MAEKETIDKIVINRKSISRFGNGKFALIFADSRWHFQKVAEQKRIISSTMLDPSCYDAMLQKGDSVFSNQGHACEDILDAIEYYAFGKNTACDFLRKKLASKYSICSMWN